MITTEDGEYLLLEDGDLIALEIGDDMAWITLAEYKLAAGIPTASTGQDALITMLIPWAQEAIEVYCDRQFDYAVYTEQVYAQNNQYLVAARNRPITVIQRTCTLNGTTAVTMASTAGIVAGMPVVGTNPVAMNGSPAIAPGTTVASVTNGTTLVLSQAATVSNAQTVFFGVQVWMSTQSYSSGEGANAYNDGNSLTPGVDYSVDLQGSTDGVTCKSGLLFGLNNFWPSQYGWNGMQISPSAGAFAANVKVVYQGGFATIPADLKMAQIMLISRMRGLLGFGTSYLSETVRDYSYSLPNLAAGRNSLGGVFTPEILFFLAKYVNIAV